MSESAQDADYVLIASHEDEHSRSELREHADRWEAVYLRPRVGGGWLVKNSVAVIKAAPSAEYVRVPAERVRLFAVLAAAAKAVVMFPTMRFPSNAEALRAREDQLAEALRAREDQLAALASALDALGLIQFTDARTRRRAVSPELEAAADALFPEWAAAQIDGSGDG